jgi:membrane protease YdiL (CAAX protease family)
MRRWTTEPTPFVSPVTDIPAYLILTSFILFWLRAVNYSITPFSLFHLYVGLWINIPLALAVTPRGLAFLKERFAGHRGYPLLGAYLFLTAFQYTVLAAYRIHPSNPQLSHLEVVLILLAYYLWYPLCALGLGYLLFRCKGDTTIDWRVFLFLALLLALRETSILISNLLVEGGVIEGFYQLDILYYKINKYSYYLELGEIWSLLIPALVLVIFAIPHKTIRLHCRWDVRTIRIGLYFMTFLLLWRLLSLCSSKVSLEGSNWLWNLATTFYPQPVYWALLEEIIFRGFLQSYLCARLGFMRWGVFLAILLTSLLFGIYHFPYIHTTWFQAMVMGLIFGWAYAKSRNLWVPVALHGFNNILSGSIFIS